MLRRLTTTGATYQYMLGAALKMEKTVLEILDDGIETTGDEQVEAMFTRHRSETEEHVRTLEEAFRRMGWEIATSPCPAIDGLQAEGRANAMKSDRLVVDAMLVQSAVAVEHYEIAVYENLVDGARAMRRKDIVELLMGSLENEQQALRLARGAHQRLVARSLGAADGRMLDKLKSAMGM